MSRTRIFENLNIELKTKNNWIFSMDKQLCNVHSDTKKWTQNISVRAVTRIQQWNESQFFVFVFVALFFAFTPLVFHITCWFMTLVNNLNYNFVYAECKLSWRQKKTKSLFGHFMHEQKSRVLIKCSPWFWFCCFCRGFTILASVLLILFRVLCRMVLPQTLV